MRAPTAQRLFDRAREGRWNLRFILPIALIVFGLFPVRARVASTMFQANRGSTNIHEQQVQMARFLGAHRAGAQLQGASPVACGQWVAASDAARPRWVITQVCRGIA